MLDVVAWSDSTFAVFVDSFIVTFVVLEQPVLGTSSEPLLSGHLQLVF